MYRNNEIIIEDSTNFSLDIVKSNVYNFQKQNNTSKINTKITNAIENFYLILNRCLDSENDRPKYINLNIPFKDLSLYEEYKAISVLRNEGFDIRYNLNLFDLDRLNFNLLNAKLNSRAYEYVNTFYKNFSEALKEDIDDISDNILANSKMGLTIFCCEFDFLVPSFYCDCIKKHFESKGFKVSSNLKWKINIAW